MQTIVEVLMQRDDMTREAAEEAVQDARERVAQGEDPEELLHEDFGLEPDYIFDLLG